MDWIHKAQWWAPLSTVIPQKYSTTSKEITEITPQVRSVVCV